MKFHAKTTIILTQRYFACFANYLCCFAWNIKKRAEVIETECGDEIAIRSMMYLSLSFDHRVVDGFLGGSFVRRVADYFEQFDVNREI